MNINKTFALFFLLLSIITFSQKKISLVDFETKKPIPQARVVYNNEISYTNDDGFVLLPSDAKTINIFILRYEQGSFEVENIIELKPIYNEIEEVIVRPVDAKKIFASVLKNYDKNYETKTSIYIGTYKTKSEIDDDLNRILLLDMDLWTLNNKFDYRKDIDEFMQINLRNKKFDKNRKDDKSYIFNVKNSTDESKYIKSFLQRFFLYNQLLILDFHTKGFKINGKIIYENNDVLTIDFKSDEIPNDVSIFEGTMQYNQKENTIIYLKCKQLQKNTLSKYTNYLDQEITTETSTFTVTYDMYKKGKKYIPAKIIMESDANFTIGDKTYAGTNYREFIYRTHNFANKKGLSNKIDLSKSITDAITDNTVKETKTLLSSEEQKFIDNDY